MAINLHRSFLQIKHLVVDGDSDVILGSKVSVSAVLPETASAAELSLRFADTQLRAPVEAGQQISSVQVWYGNMCVAEADLYAMNAVDLAGTVKIAADAQGKGEKWLTVLWIGLGVACSAACILVLFRTVGKIRVLAAKNRSKRYRRSRRRSR